MSIQWFPGHMHRARKQIAALMPKVDIVIEVLDARLPGYSENPMLQDLRAGRPCLKLLNKTDLADPDVTQLWKTFLTAPDKGNSVLEIIASAPQSRKAILQLLPRMGPQRNLLMRPLNCLIAGIPNTGKSTLLNTLAGRKVARAANQAAITTKQKRVHVSDEITLYDTPGVLWPKIEDEQASYMLAASGAVRETAMDNLEVAVQAARFLRQRYPGLVCKRYGLTELPEDGFACIDAVGRKRGCLLRGGLVDMNKAATLFLGDLRGGKIGRISLEWPPEGK